MAYGIVADGQLVHSGGFGEREIGGAVPDETTVFRIASMTKSFTASAIMTLRDEDALALDDHAERYLPELGGQAVTIRQLLTMTGGFPTDDPWGDRQQGLPLDDFGAMLAEGVSTAWPPGTHFEYSNLGYAILGRIITAVTGQPYHEVVRARLLDPLGMSLTGYEPADGGALGYRRRHDVWEHVPFDPLGAFASMGGVFSCVRDLARWVAGFIDAWSTDAGDHPLSAASRREMQSPKSLIEADRVTPVPGGRAMAYGFGLFVTDDARFGRIVSHSGGYPGFGSNMAWHPASGLGVIALGNSTYASMVRLTSAMLDTLLRSSAAPSPRIWPATVAARDSVNALLRAWDDEVAARLFSPNVDLDTPLADRRDAIKLTVERIGGLAEDNERASESDSPAHCRWWLSGPGGSVAVQIQLTPEPSPRVQSLRLAVPPAAGSPLSRVVDALVEWLNDGAADWSLPVSSGVDAGVLGRRLRMASAWAGACSVNGWRAGDGSGSASVELAGEHATLIMSVTVDPSSGVIHEANVSVLG